ncbi:iron-sulfur cluster-binding protein [Halogranum amylolyticum]|uniref:Iron-sulfur cluster-binding protein n=1 Tax=Halogranum amylolyticum TaxID=660520 RepID=A0A1H8TAW3_9EURY|nr:LUD domain-containing protein [Halogranum amylolyticum]SEO87945.1 iron-sulfur cluster-binding protein [Halogranum amylolyticum]
MSKSRDQKAAEIRRLMQTEGDAVAENTRGFNAGRYASVAELDDYEALKDEARAIKEDAIERLPELLEQVRETVEANGGTVYLADDAADANRYVREVCEDNGAERVVKSKSMTSEEIEVNEELEATGVDVVETDLGEWVLQVAEEAPSHIVAPAIHKSRAEIADLFNEMFADEIDEPLETAEELTAFAREQLGDRIEGADVGMTGANFVTADTGTIALVTSEGNARKSAVVPDTHVAVAGVEKVVPSVEDLQPFVELIGRSGTGQDITSYISLLTPPVESPPVDFDDEETPMAEGGKAEREFHLVLIDNGRLAMREDDQLRETLYCIRCSACSNVCGNFQSVGGHAFGGETYSGGIATGWEAGIEGLDTAAEFNDLCTGCSRCVNACPVEIDIPWINTVVRDRINRGESGEFDWLVDGLTPDEEPGGMDLGKRFFGNFSTVAKVGSATAPLSNWLAETDAARAAMERVLGIDRRRELPAFQRQTLVDWFEARGGSRVDATDATREAVLYPDLYTNHVQVERGKAAVRTLEALDVSVRIPDVTSSGRAPLSQGMIATAERHAHEVYGALAEHIDADRDVVVVEPSDLAMFEREYEKFLPQKSQERLADDSYEVMEYLYGLLHNGADASALRNASDGPVETDRVAYHSHCQQRTLGLEAHTVSVLDDLGYDVVTSETECCGMAGSFGYKTEYYELSMDVGEPLREQFSTDDARERTVVASGTSCLEQLDALLSRPTQHPVELVAPR